MHDIRSMVIESKKTQTSIEQVGQKLAYQLKEALGSTNITVHIDGDQCLEKDKAIQERYKRRADKEPGLITAIEMVEKNSAKGQWTRKNVMRRIDKGLQEIHVLSHQDKVMLSAGLSTEFQVCHCTTEADVCIGFQGTPSEQVVAISSDSDLLLYEGVSTFIRPLPHQRRQFGIYNSQEVLDTLELPSSNHLVLYGSVSNNDYTSNIKTLGLVRNLTLIKEINEDVIDLMLRDYLTRAADLVDIDIEEKEKDFQRAISVFAYGRQTPVQGAIGHSRFDELINRVQAAKSVRHAIAQEKKGQRDL
jgi:hypothetical protein